MKNLIVILLILGIISSFGVVLGEENSDPVIWKYKTSSWVTFVKTTSMALILLQAPLMDHLIYSINRGMFYGRILWNRG